MGDRKSGASVQFRNFHLLLQNQTISIFEHQYHDMKLVRMLWTVIIIYILRWCLFRLMLSCCFFYDKYRDIMSSCLLQKALHATVFICIFFQHEAEYRLFMEAVKGNPGEKRLASQFMTRFFKHFPSLARETINALFDLCEDADVMVSINACFKLPGWISKLAGESEEQNMDGCLLLGQLICFHWKSYCALALHLSYGRIGVALPE